MFCAENGINSKIIHNFVGENTKSLLTDITIAIMKKTVLFLLTIMGILSAQAADEIIVEVSYSGTTATISIPDNMTDHITVSTGNSSHVVITSTVDDKEIFYDLSGTTDNGSFCLNGTYKCEIDLSGLTLTNPSGPALNIQNGKRIAISAKKNSTNTLTDGKNDDYNGCIHCKGHLEFKGKGQLNVAGNSKHAIYSGEYVEIKNLTLNITGAKKDGIHCKEYFLMESGTVTISNTGDDGIQCELDGDASTGELDEHEDEDTGNVYQLDGTLTIKDYSGKAIKADGGIFYRGGTQGFDTSDTVSTGIETVQSPKATVNDDAIYDLNGRHVSNPSHGIYIQNGKKYVK